MLSINAGMLGSIPPRVFIFSIAALVSLVLIINLGLRSPSATMPKAATFWKNSNPKDIFKPIQNETLGFEKIFVVNLPERTDKRDALTLAASLTGIKLDFVPAMKGEDIIDKALPVGQEDRKMSQNNVGSWRSHMNAIRAVVDQGLSSALILEDDVDWDIRLKSQLVDFAKGARWLMNTRTNARTNSPYGEGWDVLWIGVCSDVFPKDDDRMYVVPNDQSVPDHMSLKLNNIDQVKTYPEHSRLVHMAGGPICSFAYAVNYRSAQKLLFGASVKELRGIFDNALSWWCTDHSEDAQCIVGQPAYFFHHRPAGLESKISDIGTYGGDGKVRKKGETQNIRWSVRNLANLEKLLTGKTDYEDSYPDGAAVVERAEEQPLWNETVRWFER